MITEPTTLFVFLATLLGLIFWAAGSRALAPVFKILPVVLLAYFLPAVSTSLGVIPPSSPVYVWMTRYLLPVSLILLLVTVDLKAIWRLGGTALGMMLAGSLGVVLGGPVALALFGHWLPADAWKGFAALSGSWIGGTANMVAIKESVGTPDSLLGPIIVVDTVVGYGWMVLLLFISQWQGRFDRWVGADTSAIQAATARLEAAEQRRRPSELRDFGVILALGFAGATVCIAIGERLPVLGSPTIISHTTWTVLLATTIGLVLSFTPVARLEEAGASRLGTLALYLLITAIGAQADLAAVVEAPLFLAAGVVWIAVHVLVLLGAARLLRAPLVLVATGSMANIGAVVSAPVVASVYHRSLAPVGVLLGVAGYIIGMYGGLVCAWLLARVQEWLLS
jgi:uncharacterized membrane protein